MSAPLRPHMSTAFLEDYLLSEDRLGQVSKEFDKDHNEYWFYSVLALQNAKDADDRSAQVLLKTWLKKLENTGFVEHENIKRLLLRQALNVDSEATADRAALIARLTDVLTKKDSDISSKEQESGPEPKSNYIPDPPNRMVEQALAQGPVSEIFTYEATPLLAKIASKGGFSPQQIGELLDLVADEPPDQHHLITLIVKDLRNNKNGWNSRAIHKKLTKDQMDQVQSNQPELLEDIQFCEAYALKLRGGAVPLYGEEATPLKDYLAELYKFSKKVKTLNSFKGLITYNYLTFLESTYEQYERSVMQQYLRIPKTSTFMAKPASSQMAQKNDYVIAGIPELSPVGNDELYIRRALRFWYSTGDKAAQWPELNGDWALSLWAEEALLACRGNERFQTAQKATIDKFNSTGYSRELLKRKILELTPMNRKYYKVDEEVELDLWLKNMPSVVVNVYMVCAEAYYVQNLREVPSNLNLAGCEPFESFDVAYDDRNEMALIKERIKISSLSGKRGLFIIDILGGDIGVRAMIRKGNLRFIERQVDEGYRFKVMNELNQELPDGKVHVLGQWHYPDETGEILVPFAEVLNMEEPVVVSCKNSSVALLSTFDRKPHKYSLVTGFYVEREHMLAKKMAKLVMRPNLYINEFAVSLKHLKNTTLTVTTTDNVNAKCTRVVEVALSDNDETISEFLVPVCMRSVECTLKGEVQGVKVQSRQYFEINQMDNGAHIADMFMYTAGAAGYVISVQGKNGEPYANETLDIELEHRMFQETLKVKLKSDHNGMVYLGKLANVRSVTCRPCNPVVYTVQKWNILQDKVNVPPVICSLVGDPICIPWIPRPQNPPRIRIYDEAFASAYHDKAQYKGGYIRVNGLPAGDYVCFIRDQQAAKVSLHVQEGKKTVLSGNDFVMGANKSLELSEAVPLQICSVKGRRAKGFELRLDGINEKTRLHAFAVTHLPRYTAFSLLAAPNTHPEVNGYKPMSCIYEPAHLIASESAYVMNRKTPKAVPNMLTEPSVLTGKWAPGKMPTMPPPPETAEEGKFVDNYRERQYEKSLVEVYGAELKTLVDTSNLEFLRETARSMPNLKPNENGIVTIPADMYTDQHRLLYFVGVDDDNTVLRHVILEEATTPTETNDCTLDPGLPVLEHYMERRRCMCLMPGDELRIEDILTSEFEPFEGIDEMFYLYRALKSLESAEAKAEVAQFEWLVLWESLSEEERLANWEKFQCNEVNYFLFKKDKDFFTKVVVPALKSKLQKTFFDMYLLGEDVSAWTKLDLLVTLNTFERILLAHQIGGAWAANCCENIKTEAALVPDRPQDSDSRILLALKSRQLSQDLMDQSMPTPAAAAPDAIPTETEVEADEIIKGLGLGSAPEAAEPSNSGPTDLTRIHEERWYFGVPLAKQTRELIVATNFWRDYANYICGIEQSRGYFLSEHSIKATRNLSEMLLALACTDLPFSAPSPKMTELPAHASRRPATLVASHPVMIFLKEIAPSSVRTSSFSISTNYFDPAEKTQVVDGNTVDRFLLPKSTIFKTGKVYGCRAVITNVSSVPQSVELLMQIPGGSIPVKGTGDSGFRTKNFKCEIDKFDTHKKEYYFYWPAPGQFEHWPAHISKNNFSVGLSNMATTVVVEENPKEVKDNYRSLCDSGQPAEIMEYLNSAGSKLYNLDLEALRPACLKNYELWRSVCALLTTKNLYCEALWSISLKVALRENAQPYLATYLSRNDEIRKFVGPQQKTGALTYNGYDHRDFQYHFLNPMTNSRVETTQALPRVFTANYDAFLNRIAFKSSSISTVNLTDKAALCCYLLQASRYDRAYEVFKSINPKRAAKNFEETYNYMDAFLALTRNDPDKAFKLAQKYCKNEDLPPQHRFKWNMIMDQVKEAQNVKQADMTFIPERIKAEPPMYDIECLKHKLKIKHNKAAKGPVMLEFWIMDLEMLFSVQPFSAHCDSFRYMQPNKVMEKSLTGGSHTIVDIPSDLRNCNSIIRLSWGVEGKGVVINDYDNEIDVQVAKDIGEVRVVSTEEKTLGQAVRGAYCKVYSKNKDGSTQFYKDGYTDIRGRWNYRDISTSDQMKAEMFALLVTTNLGSSKIEIPAN